MVLTYKDGASNFTASASTKPSIIKPLQNTDTVLLIGPPKSVPPNAATTKPNKNFPESCKLVNHLNRTSVNHTIGFPTAHHIAKPHTSVEINGMIPVFMSWHAKNGVNWIKL